MCFSNVQRSLLKAYYPWTHSISCNVEKENNTMQRGRGTPSGNHTRCAELENAKALF